MTDDYPKPILERVVKLETTMDHVECKINEMHDVLCKNGLKADVLKNTLFRHSWRRGWWLVVKVSVTVIIGAVLTGAFYVATHYAALNVQP